jgi:hypothetical protein
MMCGTHCVMGNPCWLFHCRSTGRGSWGGGVGMGLLQLPRACRCGDDGKVRGGGRVSYS